MLIATPIGIFFAVLLDKEIRGTRFYQGALYLPVVLSLAIIGFIAQLFLSTDQGLVNGVLGTVRGETRRLARELQPQPVGHPRSSRAGARSAT